MDCQTEVVRFVRTNFGALFCQATSVRDPGGVSPGSRNQFDNG